MQNNNSIANKKCLQYLLLIIGSILIIYLVIIAIFKLCIYPRKYKEYVEEICGRYAVDPYLVYAVIKQESNFNSDATSNKAARGLMQVIDSTAKEVAADINSIDQNNFDIYDVETNLEIGIKYLSTLIARYNGNWYIALASYNAGMGNVDKWYNKDTSSYDNLEKVVKEIKFDETKKYVCNITSYYNSYKRLYQD